MAVGCEELRKPQNTVQVAAATPQSRATMQDSNFERFPLHQSPLRAFPFRLLIVFHLWCCRDYTKPLRELFNFLRACPANRAAAAALPGVPVTNKMMTQHGAFSLFEFSQLTA